MIQLSNAARDKLQAAANRDLADADDDDDLGAAYREACARWYAALTPAERTRATAAVTALNLGREPDAEEFARVLPPAPVFPLP